MKGYWRVTCNIIDGRRMYAVYCLIDPTRPDHSGNRELAGGYIGSREMAEIVAKKLNLGGRWTRRDL